MDLNGLEKYVKKYKRLSSLIGYLWDRDLLKLVQFLYKNGFKDIVYENGEFKEDGYIPIKTLGELITGNKVEVTLHHIHEGGNSLKNNWLILLYLIALNKKLGNKFALHYYYGALIQDKFIETVIKNKNKIEPEILETFIEFLATDRKSAFREYDIVGYFKGLFLALKELVNDDSLKKQILRKAFYKIKEYENWSSIIYGIYKAYDVNPDAANFYIKNFKKKIDNEKDKRLLLAFIDKDVFSKKEIYYMLVDYINTIDKYGVEIVLTYLDEFINVTVEVLKYSCDNFEILWDNDLKSKVKETLYCDDVKCCKKEDIFDVFEL